MVVSKTAFKKSNIALPAVLLLCLLVAIFIQSRAFIIGYGVSLVILGLIIYKERVKVWHVLIAVLSLSLLLTILTICLKSDSSLGRLLIYKISFRIFKDHWLEGIGLGNFQHLYGLYQAAYFRAGNYTTKELLLAGNTYFAFNDYWQLMIELGLKGIVLVVIFFIGLGRLLRHIFQLKVWPPFYLLLAILQIIAMVTAAFFTHVFEKEYNQVIIITAITIILYSSGLLPLRHLVTFWFSACVWLCSGLINFYILHYKSYHSWQKASELSDNGYIAEALKIYEGLFPTLKENPPFLANYSDLLLASGQYKHAESILISLVAKRTQNDYYEKLGRCYWAEGKFQAAEIKLQLAIDMVPNRFATRYSLYRFYLGTGQHLKAAESADRILSLPIKIPSEQIAVMRQLLFQQKHKSTSP